MENVKNIRKQKKEVQAQMLYSLMRTRLLLKELSFYNGHPTKFVPGYAVPQDAFLKVFDDQGKDGYSWEDILRLMQNEDCIGWQFVCALDEEDNNRAQLVNLPILLPIFEFQVFMGAGEHVKKYMETLFAEDLKLYGPDEYFGENTEKIRNLLWRHWQSKYEELFAG